MQLGRICGSWPPPELMQLTKTEMQKFLARSHNLSAKELEALVVEHMAKEYISTTMKSIGGTYQPLSYWERQGYNVDAIVRNSPPENIETHAVLGTTYKVDLKTVNRETAERQVRSVLAGRRDEKRISKAAKCSDEEEASDDPAVQTKKAKKGKGGNKSAKEQEQALKVLEKKAIDDVKRIAKEAEKLTQDNKKVAAKGQQDALRGYLKIKPMLETLRQIAKEPLLHMVPEFAKASLQETIPLLEAMEKESAAGLRRASLSRILSLRKRWTSFSAKAKSAWPC
jgi:hypothetical protein